jgi:hypothetical protein
MEDRRFGLGHDKWCRLSHVRLAQAIAVAGAFLTAVTVVICTFNAIKATQAIALAIPATLMTVGGATGVIVPDVYAAWRRGFRLGCKVAMSCQAHDDRQSDRPVRHHRRHSAIGADSAHTSRSMATDLPAAPCAPCTNRARLRNHH